ncbi:PepSY domain-containing protein [Pseudomonas sp.]|uniref:PepSY domain-containing protein n=1 Tax=Pseudomonas sp. TaxID=306 RepID=UPI0028AE3C89|nr:PepSY domain-containing protein [Pseudomonas sp.]
MNRFTLCCSALAASLSLALVIPASARDLDQDEALRLREKGIIQPLETLLQNALGRHPGARLLEAELEEEDDILVYEIELLTSDGVVREIELDASSGKILKDEEDD